MDTSSIKLFFAKRPRKGETGYLKTMGEELALLDSNEKLIARIPLDEAMIRIKLPSFWSSRYIVIDGDDGETLCFEPKPKAIEKLKLLFSKSVKEGRSRQVSETLHRSGIRSILIGAGLFILGVLITAISYFAAAPGGTYIVTTGLIGVGIAGMARGISHMAKSDNVRVTVSNRDEYLTLSCSACNAPFRVSNEHAGRRVACPSCKTAVTVPHQPENQWEEHDRTELKPVRLLIIGGGVVLVLLIAFVVWMMIDSSPKVAMPTNFVRPPIPTQPNNFAQPDRTQSKNSSESGIHTEHETEDPQLGAQRPFAIDPGLLRKTGSVYLSDLTEFAYKKGADGWLLGKHGKLIKPFGKADILVNGKPVKQGLSMHPPHTGFTRAAYVVGRSVQKLIGSVGMSEDEPQFTPQPTRFVIMGDGKMLWRSKSISGFGTQEAFEVNIGNVDLLELRVYSESFNITGSHAVWIDPQVVLKQVGGN